MVLSFFSCAKSGKFNRWSLLACLLATLANLIPYVFSALAEWIWLWRQGRFQWGMHSSLVLRSVLTYAFVTAAILGTGWNTIGSGLVLLVLGMPVFAWLKWRIKN